MALWQWHEYGHERELAEQMLRRQAGSVMNALIGGIRSHRRMGRFFQGQLQGTLDVLVEADDVLAVAITSDDGRTMLSAGKAELLDGPTASERGCFRLSEQFELAPDTGSGPHGGRGGGRGWGRRLMQEPSAIESLFSAGGKFVATLWLDRTAADTQCRRAALARSLVVAAGTLVLICAALIWRATVRLAESHGRTRMLETEARHLRDLGRAAAGLAHETRNPLGLIRGWTQRLSKSNLASDEQKRQVKAVIEECDRVTSRINQFLAFARPCEPKLDSVDISKVLDELAVLLEPDLGMKNLSLDFDALRPGETVRADRELLRQALFNLIQNAIQFAPEGGVIEIAMCSRQDGGKRIEVADRGPGVDAEVVELLFTPYFTTRSDGTGLGLAIVRRIAVAHGWHAGYTPRPGGGAIFWLDGIHD